MMPKIIPNRKRTVRRALYHLFLIAFGVVFMYPFIWLILGCFKSNDELFRHSLALPQSVDFSIFIRGWRGIGRYNYGNYFINTFFLVIPMVLLTLISAQLIAYGFAWFKFPFKRLFFILMISTMMLPSSVTLIPRYVMFSRWGLVNSYVPLIAPALFGGSAFFIFMLIQFIRGIPKDLGEAALLDGCSSFGTLYHVITPLCVPALFTAGTFQFIWTWNDFLNQLIYINSTSMYTISLGLHMTLDATSNIQWNSIFAMSLLSVVPLIVLFFIAQKYLVEGIATTGLK